MTPVLGNELPIPQADRIGRPQFVTGISLQRHFFSPLSLGVYDVRDMPGDCAVGSKPQRRGSPQSYKYAGATRLRITGGAATP